MKNTWTLLIYANGNNELEPEMSKAFYDLINSSPDCNFNIVVEIGRMNREIARILRPDEQFENYSDSWVGVRRYIIKDKNAQLVEDISYVNMADPKEVYNFIKWGMDRFKSEHYMLVMGGHGSSFIGMVTDYSKNMPYGLPTIGVCSAINRIVSDTGKYIDILLLDMCYMNVVEVMYELGKTSRNTVKNIITYTGDGPMSGISYSDLLSILRDNIKDADSLVQAIIKNMRLSLAGYKIDHGRLLKIKKLANDTAYSYLVYCLENKLDIKPEEVKNCSEGINEWTKYMLELNKSMKSIVIDYNRSFYNGRKIIEIICSNLGELAPSYLRMSFAKNNYWAYLVSGLQLNKSLCNPYEEISLEPKILTFNSLYSLILVSMAFDSEKAKEIFMKLIKYRNWTL